MKFFVVELIELIVVLGGAIFLLTQVILPGLLGRPMFGLFRPRRSNPIDNIDIKQEIKDAEQALELERRRAELDRLREARINAILNDPIDLEGGEKETATRRGGQSTKQSTKQ